jgi:chaperonin GroES
VVGCAFRKTWWDAPRSKPCSALVSPLRLVVSAQAKSLQTAPRVTEEIPDVYPYQITARVRSGFYRDVDLPATGEDDQAPRMLLEQHRLDDLDGDGFEEPYVVTVDKETRQVLRLESAYSPEQVKMNAETDEVVEIDRFVPYTKYSFLPDPEGGFYDIGFGHLLEPLTAVIDTTINQMLDAGHAQVAGGGFIASGLRLQGSGQSGALKWRPGEYKTVNASGQDLRNAIYERTFPAPSPILFQLLDLMLGAAKDIASIKDVITGDAPTTAPVGTTQAMIEQGLQVFTAIYKRVYRALREEFRRFYGCVSAYGDPQDYLEVVDDPEADFDRDFNLSDKDICPVSDPSVATKLQAMGKAQLLLGFTGRGLNDPEIYKRAFRAFDIEDPDELIPPAPSGPPPNAVADVEKTESETVLNRAKTLQIIGETAAARVTHDANLGGVSGLGGSPADAMGPVGLPEGLAGPEGGVGPAVMGGGGFGPGAPDGVAYEG